MGLRGAVFLGPILVGCGTPESELRFQGEPCERATWYADADQDGFGDPAVSTLSCDAPPGYRDRAGDCDDRDDRVHPEAQEACGTDAAGRPVDEDCDGLVDEADDSLSGPGSSTWFLDGDADGYGLDDVTTLACGPIAGHASVGGDCDDTDPDLSPAAEEICDGLGTDEDCDGLVDDADDSLALESASSWAPDADEDGFGDAGVLPVFSCEAPAGGGWSSAAGDCDDSDDSVFPGAEEWCDGVDSDCDGSADDLGLASFVDLEGAWTSVEAALGAGSADESIEVELDEDGQLLICPGTWHLRLRTGGHDVDLLGVDGGGEVVLDGSGRGPVVSVEGGSVLLEGLDIQGGLAEEGGGLHISDSAQVVARSVVLSGNLASADGGGVLLSSGATLVASDLVVQDNEAGGGGGGIAMESGTELVLEQAHVLDNRAQGGGGGVAVEGGSLTWQGGRLSGNSSEDRGGGIVSSLTGDSDLVAASALDVVENSPDQIWDASWEEAWDFGLGASFKCTASAGCEGSGSRR